MKDFKVPTLGGVSPANAKILESINKNLGFTPNIYAYIANSPTALNSILALGRTAVSLSEKEKEVINLVASQIRKCNYCLSAHTAISTNAGFTAEEIMEIRQNKIAFDNKLKALANMVAATVESRNKVPNEVVDNFFAAGYTEANMVDMCLIMSEISFTNFINNITNIPVDFPLASEL